MPKLQTLSAIRDQHPDGFTARAEIDGRMMMVNAWPSSLVYYDDKQVKGDPNTDPVHLAWTFDDMCEGLFVEYGIEEDACIWQDVTPAESEPQPAA